MEIVEKMAEALGIEFVAEREETSLKGTKIIARGKAEGRDPGNTTKNDSDPEGVEQTAPHVAPLQGANTDVQPVPGLHPGLLSSSPSATGTFAPIDILDYIYAVLHSPSYREKYKEFLKIDFPRVPYPTDKDTFWQLVNLGGELRQIHLLESAKVNEFITGYPVTGDNVVEKPVFKSEPGAVATGSTSSGVEKNPVAAPTSRGSDKNPVGGDNVVGTPKFVTGTQASLPATPLAASPTPYSANVSGSDAPDAGRMPAIQSSVFINATQYFEGVPETAWNFYIGGYQPAQKWLKDRKGRALNFDDIRHYQKIIVALTETDRLMKEIDKINFID